MKEILPDIFAIEVAYVATKFEVRPDGLRPQIRYEWFNKIRYIPLPVGSYQILFTTKDCSEEQAGSVVESGYLLYKDYQQENIFRFTEATESLQSLLRSHNLTGGNYLLIKKQP